MKVQTLLRHVLYLEGEERFRHQGLTGTFQVQKVEVRGNPNDNRAVTISGPMVKKDGTLGAVTRTDAIHARDLPKAVYDAIGNLPSFEGQVGRVVQVEA